MDTRDLYPHEILQEAIGKSCAKSEFSIKMLVILSFFRAAVMSASAILPACASSAAFRPNGTAWPPF